MLIYALFIDCRESHLRTFCREIHQCARIGGLSQSWQCQDFGSASHCNPSLTSNWHFWQMTQMSNKCLLSKTEKAQMSGQIQIIWVCWDLCFPYNINISYINIFRNCLIDIDNNIFKNDHNDCSKVSIYYKRQSIIDIDNICAHLFPHSGVFKDITGYQRSTSWSRNLSVANPNHGLDQCNESTRNLICANTKLELRVLSLVQATIGFATVIYDCYVC